jgi:hypothetical protein
MPWYFWLAALSLVTAIGVVKGKRTRSKVWRAIRRYVKKRTSQRVKARGKARTAQRQSRPRRRTPAGWQSASLVDGPRVKRAPVFRAQVCRLACRQSVKPPSTCDCACGGRDHGRYRLGTAASIRATKLTPVQKRAQRVAEGNERYRRSRAKSTPSQETPTPQRTKPTVRPWAMPTPEDLERADRKG